jgi:hypothetical protein
MEPDTPTRGGRMSHCSLFDSGVLRDAHVQYPGYGS